MIFKREPFLSFCSEITGYSAFDLEGTGLVDAYRQLIEDVLGPQLTRELNTLVDDVLFYPEGSKERDDVFRQHLLAPSLFWPVVSALISLWYLGTWNQLPETWYAAVGMPMPGPHDAGRTHVPSMLSYIEQLSYRTASAHTPGAKPPGFGSWSKVPVEQ